MDDAGMMADLTSPMAATPAGKDNTPEPTAPLIRLNDAIGIEHEELSLSASLFSEDDDDFMFTRALALFFRPPASPPRYFVVDSAALVAGENAFDVVTTAMRRMVMNFMLCFDSLRPYSVQTNDGDDAMAICMNDWQ